MHTTIALTRFNESGGLVSQTLKSLAVQKDVKADVFFLDQRDDPELALYCKKLSNNKIDFHCIRIEPICVSFARNQAIKLCRTDSILFIDADAIAHEDWAFHLSDTLINKYAAVAGGKIIPKWHEKPSFLVKSNFIRDQYSLMDLGEDLCNVPKVVGANMGIHIRRMGIEAYFDENLGRRNGNLAGGADIDVCERALKIKLQVKYNGQAIVTHQILPERLTYKWLFRRFYWGGRSKAQKLGRLSSTPTNPRNLWDYIGIPVFLIPYMYGFLSYKFMIKK